jgi:hypothetical protein
MQVCRGDRELCRGDGIVASGEAVFDGIFMDVRESIPGDTKANVCVAATDREA